MFIELLKLQKKADLCDKMGKFAEADALDRRIDKLATFISNIYKYDLSDIKGRLIESKNNLEKYLTASRHLEHDEFLGYTDLGKTSPLNHAVNVAKIPSDMFNIRFDPDVPYSQSAVWKALQERMQNKPVSDPEQEGLNHLTPLQAFDIIRYFDQTDNRSINIRNQKRMRDLFPGMPFDLFAQLMQKARPYFDKTLDPHEIQVENPVINSMEPEDAYREVFIRMAPFGAGDTRSIKDKATGKAVEVYVGHLGANNLDKKLRQKLMGGEFSNSGEAGSRKDFDDFIREGDFVSLFDHIADEFKAYSQQQAKEFEQKRSLMTDSDKRLLGNDPRAIAALKRDYQMFMDEAKVEDPFDSRMEQIILSNWDFSSYEVSPFSRQGLPESAVAKWFPNANDHMDLAQEIRESGLIKNMSINQIAESLSAMGMYYTKIADRISRDREVSEDEFRGEIPPTQFRYNPELKQMRLVFDVGQSQIANKNRRLETAVHLLEMMQESGQLFDDDELLKMNYRIFEAVRNAKKFVADTSMNRGVGGEGTAEMGDRSVELSSGPVDMDHLDDEGKDLVRQIEQTHEYIKDYSEMGPEYAEAVEDLKEMLEQQKARLEKLAPSKEKDDVEYRRKRAEAYISKMENRQIFKQFLGPALRSANEATKNAYLDWFADLIDDYIIREDELGRNPTTGALQDVDEEDLMKRNWMQIMQKKRTDGKKIVDIEVLQDPVYDLSGKIAVDKQGNRMKGLTTLIFEDGTKANVKSAPTRKDARERIDDVFDEDGVWKATMVKDQITEMRDGIESPDLDDVREFDESYESDVERDVDYEFDDYIGDRSLAEKEVPEDLQRGKDFLKSIAVDDGFIEWLTDHSLSTVPGIKMSRKRGEEGVLVKDAFKIRDDLILELGQKYPSLIQNFSTKPLFLSDFGDKFINARARSLAESRNLFYTTHVLGIAPSVAVGRIMGKSGASDYVKGFSQLVSLFYNRYRKEMNPEAADIDVNALLKKKYTPKESDQLINGIKNGEGFSEVDYQAYLTAKAVQGDGYNAKLSAGMLGNLGYSSKRMKALLIMSQRQYFDAARIGAINYQDFRNIIGFNFHDPSLGEDQKQNPAQDSETQSIGDVPYISYKQVPVVIRGKQTQKNFNSMSLISYKINDYKTFEKATLERIGGQPVQESDFQEFEQLKDTKQRVAEELGQIRDEYAEACESRLNYFNEWKKMRARIFSSYTGYLENIAEEDGTVRPTGIRVVNEKNAVSALTDYLAYLKSRYIDQGDMTLGDKAQEFIRIIEAILAEEDESEGTTPISMDVPASDGRSRILDRMIQDFEAVEIPNPFVEEAEEVEDIDDEEVVEDEYVEDEAEEEVVTPRIPKIKTPEEPEQPYEIPPSPAPPAVQLKPQELQWLMNAYTNPNLPKMQIPANIAQMLIAKGFVEGQHIQPFPGKEGAYQIIGWPEHVLQQLGTFASNELDKLEKLSMFSDDEIDAILKRYGI
jgi:hypothetical protein